MQVNIENNTNRKYYRIELPARVKIKDKFYEVKDWSLGGFMIDSEEDVCRNDWEGTVKLLLPFDGVEVAVVSHAKVAWVSEGRAGFTFENLSSRGKNILKTYLKSSIEGNLGEIDGVLSYVDSQEIPLPTEKPMTESEESNFKSNFYKRSLRYGIIALSFLTIVAIIFLFSITKSTSLRAIVSADKVNVDAPFEGKITRINFKDGDMVKKGDILANLDDREILLSIETQRHRIEVVKKELLEAKSWLKLVSQGRNMYSKYGIYADMDVFKAQVAVKNERIKEENSKLNELLETLEKTNLRSPCDGKLYVAKQTSGSSVHQGDELFIIQPSTNESTYVLARFSFESSKGISVGSRADIYVPSMGKKFKGTVEAMGHQALGGTQSTSPDLEISYGETPVRILLDDNSLQSYNGAAAIVDIHIPVKAKLGHIL